MWLLPFVFALLGVAVMGLCIAGLYHRKRLLPLFTDETDPKKRDGQYHDMCIALGVVSGIALVVFLVAGGFIVHNVMPTVPAGYVLIVGDVNSAAEPDVYDSGTLVIKKPWRTGHLLAKARWSDSHVITTEGSGFFESRSIYTLPYTVRRMDPPNTSDWISIWQDRGDHEQENLAVKTLIGEVALKVVAEVPGQSVEARQNYLNTHLFDRAKPRLAGERYELVAVKCSSIK